MMAGHQAMAWRHSRGSGRGHRPWRSPGLQEAQEVQGRPTAVWRGTGQARGRGCRHGVRGPVEQRAQLCHRRRRRRHRQHSPEHEHDAQHAVPALQRDTGRHACRPAATDEDGARLPTL